MKGQALYNSIAQELKEKAKKSRTLQNTAEEACLFMGHVMTYNYISDNLTWGRCIECNARVEINLSPEPNKAEITGEAIRVRCPKWEE